jgi:hypothetical protein
MLKCQNCLLSFESPTSNATFQGRAIPPLHEAEAPHYIFTWSKPHPPLSFGLRASFGIIQTYYLIVIEVAPAIAICYHSCVERRTISAAWLGMSIEG